MPADMQEDPPPLFRKVGVWRPASGTATSPVTTTTTASDSASTVAAAGGSGAAPNASTGTSPTTPRADSSRPSQASGANADDQASRHAAEVSGAPPPPVTAPAPAADTENVVEIRTIRDPALVNTRARRVHPRWNAFAAPCHVVTADGVLFCLPEKFVRERSSALIRVMAELVRGGAKFFVWRAHYDCAPRELVVGEGSGSLSLVLGVWCGQQRLDVLPGRAWPLAEDLLGAAYLCGRHGFGALYPLFTAYVQLAAYKTGEWAPLFHLGVHAGEPAWIALAAVQLAQRGQDLQVHLARLRGTAVPRLAAAYARLRALHDPLTGWMHDAMPPEDTFLAFLDETEADDATAPAR